MDPRVSSLLSRLGGLYRDPSRVDRDASSLLKSSVGQHLVPGIAKLVENNGDANSSLVLQGTIAIHFRGQEYQLLIDLYLPKGYPQRPPVAYVRLGAPNMYLKEQHAHVGSDGHVYLPYLHEWRPHSHNLVELVVAMSSVFSADPPVFTRTSTSSSASNTAATASAASYMDPRQEQVEAELAREADEANRVAEAARRAELQEEQERLDEMRKLDDARTKVSAKLQTFLSDKARQTQRSLQSDTQDQARLNARQLDKQVEFLTSLKASLEQHVETVDKATVDIQEWLAVHESSPQEQPEINPEDLVVASSKQMMDLAAENAALTDCMYFVDRALQKGTLELEVHLKTIRQLSKRQFLVRAHLEKLSQHAMFKR